MTRVTVASRRVSRIVRSLMALGGLLVVVGMTTGHAQVLRAATGTEGDDGRWGALVNLANQLTDRALIPVLAVAPLAAVAGAFALMIGGGGQRGNGAARLIGGAVGAVIVVVGARGFAA